MTDTDRVIRGDRAVEDDPGAGEGRVEVCRSPAPNERERLEADVRQGLGDERKELPPRYFYDARGSRLFEEITRLPEYYLTRAEREILESRGDRLVDEVRADAVVEFGSGSSSKTRLLLDPLARAGRLHGYAPVDVSEAALLEAAGQLADRYPGLRVVAVVADFRDRFDLPFTGRRRLVLFLGSTIGNFKEAEARAFLGSVAERMSEADGLLVGFDLVKDPAVLEAAYDDAAGVTAEFNKNVLRVLNRELDAGFDLDRFRHRARYDEEKARVEMHLVSTRAQMVRIEALDMDVEFREGESIRTELSHKYTRERVDAMLASSGLELRRWETDAAGRFAVALARPVREGARENRANPDAPPGAPEQESPDEGERR